MKKRDFTTEKDADLTSELAQKREEVRVFRFAVSGSATRNVRTLRNNKKDIARILTVLSARSHIA